VHTPTEKKKFADISEKSINANPLKPVDTDVAVMAYSPRQFVGKVLE
jgi:hypothetical protein